MEKNCLVTKYKATVNDTSLKKLGSIIGTMVYPTDEWFGFNKVPGSDAKVIFKQNGEVVFEVVNGRTIPAGTYDVEFVNKYNITEFVIDRFTTPIDTKEFVYTKDLVLFSSGYLLSGDIANLFKIIGPNTTNVSLDNAYNVYGNVDGSIFDNANSEKFVFLGISNVPITGTLESIAERFVNKQWNVDFGISIFNSKITLNKKLFTYGGEGQYGVDTGQVVLHRTENGCTVSRNDVLMATLADSVWTYES